MRHTVFGIGRLTLRELREWRDTLRLGNSVLPLGVL